ncbi:AraC family transcriptional regulator [Bradyrhizobium sp. UFLA05-109]
MLLQAGGPMQDLQPFRHVRISTQDIPEKKRLATWREIYGRGIASVDIDPIGDAPFHADVTFSLMPDVYIAAGSRSPAHYRITRELAGRSRDGITISILRSGAASATQFGKELISGVGSASVLTSDAPSTSSLHSEGSFITLGLLRPAIAALVPNLSSAFGRPIPSENRALRLLTRYLDIVQTGDELGNREIAHSVSTHILDLAALALGARGDSADIAKQRGARAARLAAIRSDVLRRLGHGDLSAEGIAASHRISSRYLRKLFEEEGSSFSSFVLAERLIGARRMLIDRYYAHLNIAQIAHENGFNDISNFNRAFRRQFGATPSDFRDAAKREWLT